MPPSGIEPTNFRFLTQCLNNSANVCHTFMTNSEIILHRQTNSAFSGHTVQWITAIKRPKRGNGKPTTIQHQQKVHRDTTPNCVCGLVVCRTFEHSHAVNMKDIRFGNTLNIVSNLCVTCLSTRDIEWCNVVDLPCACPTYQTDKQYTVNATS